MNTLSWLLYLADVSSGLKVLSGFGIAGSVLAAFFVPPKGVKAFSGDHIPFSGLSRPAPWACVVLCSAVLVLAPSGNTLMRIAASEVGETILASDEAQAIGGEAGALATDSLRVLRKFINEQLEEKAE